MLRAEPPLREHSAIWTSRMYSSFPCSTKRKTTCAMQRALIPPIRCTVRAMARDTRPTNKPASTSVVSFSIWFIALAVDGSDMDCFAGTERSTKQSPTANSSKPKEPETVDGPNGKEIIYRSGDVDRKAIILRKPEPRYSRKAREHG